MIYQKKNIRTIVIQKKKTHINESTGYKKTIISQIYNELYLMKHLITYQLQKFKLIDIAYRTKQVKNQSQTRYTIMIISQLYREITSCQTANNTPTTIIQMIRNKVQI